MALRKILCAAAVFVVFVWVATPAAADSYAEVGDASHVYGQQQHVGYGVDTITGSWAYGDLGDLFEIEFATAVVDLDIVTAQNGDTEIFLFRADGSGIQAADLSPRLPPQDLPAGTYILGIGGYNTFAVDTEGREWNTYHPGYPNTVGDWTTLSHLTHRLGVAGNISYTITLSYATSPADSPVPEPATFSLFALGVLAVTTRRRRTA